MPKTNIYIDGNNLHRSAKELGFAIDYKRFRNWLRQKYDPVFIYLFIGLVPKRVKLYERLQKCGYILVFKQTISVCKKIKGNCDAELILKSVTDYYTKSCDACILVTGDGDFGCLATFLKENGSINCIIAPDRNKCSFLLRNKNIKITFLNEQYYKFSREIKKAPGKDVSRQGSFS
jgi:uncharacterized LabA/DUF88 family protein